MVRIRRPLAAKDAAAETVTMGAQSKLADPALTPPLADAAPNERSSTADYQSPRNADGEIPASPAILLQEHLAARIAGAGQTRAAADAAKWPMPLRIATIVGLSAALWAGIVMVAAAVLT
ncbi:MAG: hypothetical protein JSR79_09345 [Proteobacteria bacterium]|nr:hypothetical protein [Pseudomonadota bacterium]